MLHKTPEALQQTLQKCIQKKNNTKKLFLKLWPFKTLNTLENLNKTSKKDLHHNFRHSTKLYKTFTEASENFTYVVQNFTKCRTLKNTIQKHDK